MPTLKLTERSVNLTSTWRGKRSGTGDNVWYSTPTTGVETRNFDLSGIPVGSEIKGAVLTTTRWGSGKVRTMYGKDADTVNIPVEDIIAGGKLEVVFIYQAVASGFVPMTPGAVKDFSASAGWNEPTLAVSYVEPLTPPSAPTTLSVDPEITHPGTTAILRWSGAEPGIANAITGYTIYQSAVPEGPFVKLASIETTETEGMYPVDAPSYGIKYFKVSTTGAVSSSLMSAASASLQVDFSQTSDFILFQGEVEAGTELRINISSNVDKAHQMKVSYKTHVLTVDGEAGAANLAVTIPMDWLNEMPLTAKDEMKVCLRTIGTGIICKPAYIVCPDSAAPSLGDITVEAIDGNVPAEWGFYVATRSKLRATLATASVPQYGAQIVRYSISGVGGQTESPTVPFSMDTGFLTAGDQDIVVEVRDTRGKTASKTVTVNAIPYELPTISSVLTYRCQSNGEPYDEGTYASGNATGEASSLNGRNEIILTVEWEERTGQWVSGGVLLNGTVVFGGNLSIANNYKIKYKIRDSVGGTSEAFDTLSRSQIEFNIRRGGGAWAFGGAATLDQTLKVYGSLDVDGITKTSNLFSYDGATNTLSISPYAGTFTYDPSTKTLNISDGTGQ